MLGRLLLGIIKGLGVGGLVGFGLVKLGFPTPSPVIAYIAASVSGVLVGLIAGKPIWAKGATVEASTKAIVGGLLGIGILAAVRALLMIPVPLPLAPVFPAHALVGGFAGTALAIVAAVLGGFYEADNNPADASVKPVTGARIGSPKNGVAPKQRAVHEVEHDSPQEEQKHLRR